MCRRSRQRLRPTVRSASAFACRDRQQKRRAPAEAIEAFRDQLAALGAYVFTINAFPYGPFHGVRVKEQVYLPDWRAPERVEIPADSAAVLSALLPAGVDGSISTVPGAFKENGKGADERSAMAVNMMRTVAGLVQIERATGKHIALAWNLSHAASWKPSTKASHSLRASCSRAASLDALATMTGGDRRTRRDSAAASSRHLLRRLSWRGGV